MLSALKFAFFAGLTFLIAAEMACGQALPPNDRTGGPCVQQHMKSDGRLAPQVCRKVYNMQDRSNQHIQSRKHDAGR